MGGAMKQSPPYPRNPFDARKVLLAIDFSANSEQALGTTLDLLKSRSIELHLVHVRVLHESSTDAGREDGLLSDLKAFCRRVIRDRGLSDSFAGQYAILSDVAPAAAILRYAADNGIELIVTGTHGRRGFRRLILGSVAEEVVRLSTVPVMTISEQASVSRTGGLHSLLVPVDFSEESVRMVRAAREIAKSIGGEVDLLHVVEETIHPAFYNTGVYSVYDLQPDLDRKAIRELQRLYSRAGGPDVEVSFSLRQGHAAKNIVEYAKDRGFDLIVMATHGLTGLSHVLIGSVTETVVRTSSCPVLILPRIAVATDRRRELAGEMLA